MRVSLGALSSRFTISAIADISHLYSPIKLNYTYYFLMSSFDQIQKLEIADVIIK